MKAVLRQELKKRSSTFINFSIILAAVNLLCLGATYFSSRGADLPWIIEDLIIPLVLAMDVCGIYFGVLFDSAANMSDMLFKDNGYLMKMLPVSSWKLIGGKYIIGLAELVGYGIQSVVYIFLFAAIDVNGEITIPAELTQKAEIIEFFLLVLAGYLISFLFVNAMLNIMRTVSAVVTKRWKVPKAVVYVVMIVIIWFLLKWTFELLGFRDSLYADTAREVFNIGWIIAAVFFIYSAAFYALTCVLYEKAVEV